MKKLLVVAVLFLGTVALFGQTKIKDEKVFEIKSGVIEYQLEGMSKGTKTFWFDDYGRIQCTRTTTTTKVYGFSSSEDKLEIRTKEWFYAIDMKAKTGEKMKTDAAMAPVDATYSELTDAEKKQFVEGVEQSLKIKEVGTGDVLNRSCIIKEMGNGNKVWLYKNITLKSEIGIGMLKSNETAIKFDENKSIPASQFQPPAGIEIEDKTEEMKKMMEGFNMNEE